MSSYFGLSDCRRFGLWALIGVLLGNWAYEVIASPQTKPAESHYRRGTQLVRNGQLKEALAELKRAANLNPRDPRIYNMIGVAFTQLGQTEEADKAYAQALAVDPNFVPARKNRAVNAFTRRHFQVAASEFQSLVRLAPNDFVPHLFLGLLDMENLDFKSARPRLSEARRLSPGNSQVLVPLTRVEFILGRRETALEWAREAKACSNITRSERFQLAAILAQFEANAEAEELFDALWQEQPDSYELGFNLALVQYRLGRLQAALQTLQELEARRSLSGEMLNLRGWIYNKARRFREAERWLREAIKVEPDNPDHYLDLSTVLGNEGDLEAAIQVMSQGLKQGIDPARLKIQLGLLHQKRKDYSESEKWFREVLDRDPANRSAYLALANLLAATERQQEALALLEKGVRQLPSDALLHYMYGGQLLDAGRDEPAEAVLKKALQLNPLYANTHYLLGKLSLKRGDSRSAETHFEKACSFNPEHVGAYYQLSLLAKRRGDHRRASEYSRIVQRLNEQSDKEYQESFHQVVDESLQDSLRIRPPQ